MKIWKYKILPGVQRIKMPMGARFLSTGIDPDGDPCVWCEVDDTSPGRWYHVAVGVTGGDRPYGDYLGTFIKESFVGHVFYDSSYFLSPL